VQRDEAFQSFFRKGIIPLPFTRIHQIRAGRLRRRISLRLHVGLILPLIFGKLNPRARGQLDWPSFEARPSAILSSACPGRLSTSIFPVKTYTAFPPWFRVVLLTLTTAWLGLDRD
jgi:hypothetical protein